jgi:hypothetical protein
MHHYAILIHMLQPFIWIGVEPLVEFQLKSSVKKSIPNLSDSGSIIDV